MNKKKSAMPVSTAKTAYGLLSEVRKLILAEPKRYNQHEVLALYGTRHQMFRAYGADFPSCGTIGCVAGWVTTLKSNPRRLSGGCGVLDKAALILGLDESVCGELFDGSAADGRPQSPTHARSGAAHIARFQKKYAKQLKAKRLA